MIFLNESSLPSTYRQKYLRFLEELYPEILDDYKKLIPLYEPAFGAIPAGWRSHCFEILILHPAKNNKILFELDKDTTEYDPDAPQISEDKNPILQGFLPFRRAFYEFIEKYYLETHELKRELFSLLYWVSRNPDYFPSISQALAGGSVQSVLEDFNFKSRDWDFCRDDSENYRKTVISDFKNRLDQYLNDGIEQAKKWGYKEFKSRKFDRLKWLVLWNMRPDYIQRHWELIPDVWEVAPFPSKKKPDIDNLDDRKKFSKTLQNAFKEFETKYDLPVRPNGV